jgi:RNA polymerase sigma-70 factor (ECF subfamily)
VASGAQMEQRFQEIVEPNRRRLQALARSFAAPNDRDDLYQEMLLQVWRSLDGFAGRSSAGTWVYRIALNTALSYRRKTRLRERHAAPGAEIDPERSGGRVAGGRDELQILQEFIETLGDVERALFALYLEDLSYAEMADITGITESHVGVRINMIKRRFIAAYIGA